MCGVRCAVKVFPVLERRWTQVPTGPPKQPYSPKTAPRAPYPLRAPLSTRTAMMINVPSFPNTQGHQDSPVVSLAFVGVPLPADPQAVQERATPLRGVRFGATANRPPSCVRWVPASARVGEIIHRRMAREPILAASGDGPCITFRPRLELPRFSLSHIVTLAKGRGGDALQGRSRDLLLPRLKPKATRGVLRVRCSH